MKKLFSIALLMAIGCLSVLAQSERGTATLNLGGGNVTVDYGRPAFKGRDIETALPVGTEWRMGMNEATTLKTDVDLQFAGKTVPKGEYTLTTKRAEAQKWVMLIKREGTVVAEAPLTFQKVGTSTELLTIELKAKGQGATFTLLWGNYNLSTDFAKAGGAMKQGEKHGDMQAAGGESWKEMDAFHEVMAATYHPMEEGDFKPVRSRAAEMATKAKQWSDSKPPKELNTAKIKDSLAKLLRDSQALELMVKKNAKDDKIKIALTALHERFHEIVGLCSDKS
jgi:hypothetical protein